MQTMVADSNERSIPVVFLLIPIQWEEDAPDDLVYGFLGVMRELCEDNGFICVDPTEALLAADLPIEDLYYQKNDNHWTPISHQIAGEVLYEAIVNEGLAPTSNTP